MFNFLLKSLMSAVRRAERFLGPEDDWVEDDRRILYESAQRLLGGYHRFVREKGPADYVTTVHADPDAVESVLMGPYQRNPWRTHRRQATPTSCSTCSTGQGWSTGNATFNYMEILL